MERFDICKKDRDRVKSFREFLGEAKVPVPTEESRLRLTGKLYDSLFRHFMPKPSIQVRRKEQITGLKSIMKQGGINDPMIVVEILGMLRFLRYDEDGIYRENAQQLKSRIEKIVSRFVRQHSLDYDIDTDDNLQFFRIRVYAQDQRGIPSAKRAGIL